MTQEPIIAVVIGVSGCGKSTLGAALARHWHAPFYEGDDYHSPESVARMREGRPLDDQHRLPWLHNLRSIISRHLSQATPAVLSCSALKSAYRDLLGREPAIWYLWLTLPEQQLQARLAKRKNHFMPANLLQSQLSTLEAPNASEQYLKLQANWPIKKQLDLIQTHFAGVRADR